MTAKQLLAALIKGVKQDIARCEEVSKLLRHQERLLRRTDDEGLAALNRLLMPALEQLADSASKRTDLLKRLGVTPNQSGMTVLLNKLPATLSNQLAPLWQVLQDRLAQCQALNERNGQLLADQQELLSNCLNQAPVVEYGPGH
ncbi:flagellar protein FlgN [Gallaecimonas mangrovi]|uniref:flagellar protein FlgN n=1 Tax=Gallaecimonas mangrovi TaxID=2291597 RepID=UPI000E1FD532|nr:flagellar protein FlgN [Gallaecimonas mangrovi]